MKYVYAFFVNQSAYVEHYFFVRQGKLGSEICKVTIDFVVSTCIYSVGNHDQLVGWKPKSPFNMRNHVITAADHSPSFIGKPSFSFMNHFFSVVCNPSLRPISVECMVTKRGLRKTCFNPIPALPRASREREKHRPHSRFFLSEQQFLSAYSDSLSKPKLQNLEQGSCTSQCDKLLPINHFV